MKVNIVSTLKGIELTKEKLKDFKIVVIVQLLVAFDCLLVYQILNLFDIENAVLISETIFFLILGPYVYTLWDMLRNYTKSSLLLIVLFILIIGCFVVSGITVNPFYSVVSGELYFKLMIFTFSVFILVQGTVMFFTATEIFKREIEIEERLWGAACIYLLIGLSFGVVYDLCCMIKPESIPMDVPFTSIHFMKSISYSFAILGGVDTFHSDVTELIKNIGTIESVWANTFIIFVVGRLFYK